MIKLKQAVIVEGKYDKIKLNGFLDALIITTNGFGIFKDAEKRAFLRLLAKEFGLIIMTDSDSAGQVIRQHLKNVITEGEITQVYLPQIKGKEKRKQTGSAQGFLGVEGLSEECIIKALEKSGVLFDSEVKDRETLTKADLFELGVSGRENSSLLRKKVLSELDLPDMLSTSALLDYINRSGRISEFVEVCKKCLEEEDKK